MSAHTILASESRVITRLVVDYDQRVTDWQPQVGQRGVTKIVAYNEPGQMAYVAWFALYAGNEVIRRINGLYVVEVSYD